jgi:hypothetical protein
MKYAGFPWPPLLAALSISALCFLFTRARKLLFLIISYKNYSMTVPNVVHLRVIESFKNINTFLLIKYFVFSTCELLTRVLC